MDTSGIVWKWQFLGPKVEFSVAPVSSVVWHQPQAQARARGALPLLAFYVQGTDSAEKPSGVGKCPFFGNFEHHLQISVGYYFPNSRVMFN